MKSIHNEQRQVAVPQCHVIQYVLVAAVFGTVHAVTVSDSKNCQFHWLHAAVVYVCRSTVCWISSFQFAENSNGKNENRNFSTHKSLIQSINHSTGTLIFIRMFLIDILKESFTLISRVGDVSRMNSARTGLWSEVHTSSQETNPNSCRLFLKPEV